MAKKQRVSFVEGTVVVEYPTIGKVFKADTSKYPKVIQMCALAHGYKQKFGDAKSGGTPAEKYAEVLAIHESLMKGEWERTATVDLTPIICEAVARIKKVPLAKLEKIAKSNPDKVKEWGSNGKVRAEIYQIRAERAAAAAKDLGDEEDLEIEGL